MVPGGSGPLKSGAWHTAKPDWPGRAVGTRSLPWSIALVGQGGSVGPGDPGLGAPDTKLPPDRVTSVVDFDC